MGKLWIISRFCQIQLLSIIKGDKNVFYQSYPKKVNIDLSIEEENAAILTANVVKSLLDRMENDNSEQVLGGFTYTKKEIELINDFLNDLLTPMWYHSEEKTFKEQVDT